MKMFKYFILAICLFISSVIFASNAFFSSLFQKHKPSSTEVLLPVDDIKRFMAAVRQIKRHYVHKLENEKLFENAIRGVLSKLDPHSSYLDAEELRELTAATIGEFGGVGIEIAPEQNGIRVISPLDGTPADKVGMKPGDLIVKINGELVKNMTVREAVTKMRGKKGTKVKLSVVRSKTEKPIEFEVIRDIIKVKTIKSKMLDKEYGYIRISLFQEPTASDMVKAVKKLKEEAGGRLKGLILDLRNNPGGLLDPAIEIPEQFLDSQYLKNKKIVYTRGRTPQVTFEANASKRDMLSGTPIIVLINEGSASGSEIVAGALQDHKRAVIVGTRSFGKGSVQTVLPVDEHSAIKLTTGLYYTPSGRSIQAEGIQPDVWVEDLQVEKTDKVKKTAQPSETALFNQMIDRQENLEKEQSLRLKEKEKERNKRKGKKDKIKGDEGDIALDEDLLEKLPELDFQLYQALNLLKGLSTQNRLKAH